MFFRWFCKPRLKPLSKQHGSAAMKVINTSRPHCTGSGSWFSSLYHRITVSERLRTLKNNQDKSQQSTVTVIPCVQRNKAMGYGPWGYEFGHAMPRQTGQVLQIMPCIHFEGTTLVGWHIRVRCCKQSHWHIQEWPVQPESMVHSPRNKEQQLINYKSGIQHVQYSIQYTVRSYIRIPYTSKQTVDNIVTVQYNFYSK